MTMEGKIGPFTAIASEIFVKAYALDQSIIERGLETPSFERWTLSDLTIEEEELRKKVIDGCHHLKLLAGGPVGQFYDVAFNFTDYQSLRFLHENQVFAHIPDEEPISFTDLAALTDLDEVLLRRFLHHAMINGFTREPQPGYVSHSSSSRMWKHNQGLRDTISFLINDIGPSARFVNEAHARWPNSAEPNETGFNIAENTTDSFYIHLAKEKERSRRFGNGMKFIAHADLYSFDIKHLVNSFPWSSIDQPGSVLVDVGGGHGTVSRELHRHTSNVRFIVQDLPGTVAEGEANLPNELKSRISFMAHDFFNPQPVKGADIYLFRWILHNWANTYAVKIIRNQIAVMKPGAKILVQEQMPEATVDTRWSTKSKRNLDMIQATAWNSLERTLPDWEALFKEADPRLIFHGATTPRGSCQTLILAELG